MAVKHKKKVAAKAKTTKALTPKQQTAASAVKYGVPFYLLWGIAGAESTWGQGGTNLFGLLDAAEGADVSDWKSASEQSAKTLKGLKKQYGSWAKAVEHYSGYSYNESHPKELATEAGVTPANEKKVLSRTLTGSTADAGFFEPKDLLPGGVGLKILEELGINIPNPGGLLEEKEGGAAGKLAEGSVGGALGEFSPGSVGGSLLEVPTQITNTFSDFDAIAKLVVSPQFWIRVAEAIGGIILLYIALKALTGASVPGEGAVKSAAGAAAFKRLPPKQRVK